jgi:hypothetical protein
VLSLSASLLRHDRKRVYRMPAHSILRLPLLIHRVYNDGFNDDHDEMMMMMVMLMMVTLTMLT